MNALPVSLVLRDVGSEAAGRSAKSKPLSDDSAERAEAEALADARTTGFQEGQAHERALAEARLAEQAAAFERRLAAERQAWVSNESERLAALIASTVREVETRMAGTLARILKPVLAAGIERRAVSELLEAIGGLISKGELARLTVSGPEDLLQGLREHLAGKIDNVAFVPAASPDVVVTADETTFETRIGAWARAIAEEGA